MNEYHERNSKCIPKEELFGKIINERYVIGDVIGSGYSGFVCSGVDLKTKNDVAIKFSCGNDTNKLEYEEHEIYLFLGADGIYHAICIDISNHFEIQLNLLMIFF